MNLDLEALATLISVVDSGSLTAAARLQRLSPNAVSQRITRLEEELGTRLLTRTTRLVRVTEAGRRVVEQGRDILKLCRDMVSAAVHSPDEVKGVVRLGIAPDATRAFDWSRVHAMLQQHPQLTLEIAARSRETDLVAAGIDLAVWVGPLPPRAFVVRRLGEIEWHLAAAPSYVAQCGTPSRPADLERHTCLRVLGARREAFWDLVDQRGKVHHTAIGGQFESDSGEVLYNALLGGMGIGIRPAQELSIAIKQGSLVRILPRHRLPPLPVALVCDAKR